jgi:hypothetical protein
LHRRCSGAQIIEPGGWRLICGGGKLLSGNYTMKVLQQKAKSLNMDQCLKDKLLPTYCDR